MIIKGQKINDRYQIIRMIGEGGMANVYLAYDTILERNVAVKVLRGDLAGDEKFVRRFQREAIAASSLTHPNIVEMYDVGEDDSKYYIVMEYVDGKTLKKLIKKRGALTLVEVIDIMLQLTSGIACAHESYIIHRDIKPQNVMILDDGRVKITDFGIATALNSQELTQTNSVMGSVHYLPPEQANGSGATIKSDIYSLGILMYELLTGTLPFKGENAVEIAIKQMRDQIPSVCDINDAIPQSIENIILKACAKNPKNRYDNVMEMHEDIKTALDEERHSEKKFRYHYLEQELEETKVMPNLSRTLMNNQERVDGEIMDEKNNKKMSVALIVSLVAAGLIAFAMFFIIIIYPMIRKTPEISIPDVSKMTVVEAEKLLKEKGLVVETDVEENFDEKIEKGKVISTDPIANRTVKKGSSIKLIVSKGKTSFELENYVGKNILEVKGILTTLGIHLLIEEKEVDDETKYKENIIMEQNPAPKTKVVKGDTVTLYIPKFVKKYPDFVTNKSTLEEVQKFCTDNKIQIKIIYEETDKFKAGTVMSQDKTVGSVINTTHILTVKIAAEKKIVEVPDDGPKPGDI